MWSGNNRPAVRPTRSIRGHTMLLTAMLIVCGLASAGVAAGTQLTMTAANDVAVTQRAVQVQAEGLQVGMINQQTALRGYALTGRTEFLEPYDLGRRQVAAAELSLDRQTAPDSTRAAYLVMKNAAGDWQAWAELLTARIEAQGAGVLDVNESLADKRLFDAFRSAADNFEHETEMQVVAAQTQVQFESTALLILLPALGLTGLAVLLLMVSIFFRSTLRPLGELIDVASALARSEPVAIPQLDRKDEVGLLAGALAAWDRSAHERLALAQSMLELTDEVEMSTVLDLGIGRLRSVLRADQVVVLVRVQGRLDVAAARPVEFASAWEVDGTPGLPLWRVEHALTIDLSAPAQHRALAAWAKANSLGPAMLVPLVSGGRPLGAVLVARERTRPDFTPSDVQLAQVIVPGLGAAIHVSRLFMDLTEANTDLERASRVKSQFVANMSHELRTPLNSVLGFAQLLQSGDFGRLNSRQSRYVDHIVSSGHHLLELINDVLDLSKIEAGKLEISSERTWVELLLQECVGKMRPVAQEKQLDIQVEASAALRVWADPRRLRQVILNLLSNAIKFTPRGGLISVRAALDADCVRLEVADTGIGIAADQVGLIFDEFTQIDSTLSRESPGSGLGLPLSRRLVEIMGGSLTVESQAGQGSTFVVVLRAAAALEGAIG